jgi:hypothetical protein
MGSTPNSPAGVAPTIFRWIRKQARNHGLWPTLRALSRKLGEFLRDSTPARRRRRYGDVEYDWDYRVDTTGATVGWRDRLLGLFHSPYQPTEPALFREMLQNLPLDLSKFVFIDIGSGKGRTLLMASDFPFRRILGVELLPALHRVCRENLRRYQSKSQKCFAVEAMCGDACQFVFPTEAAVVYLFNPLPAAELRQLIANLEHSLDLDPRPVYVIYHNPVHEEMFRESRWFRTIAGTDQYSLYANAPGAEAVEE